MQIDSTDRLINKIPKIEAHLKGLYINVGVRKIEPTKKYKKVEHKFDNPLKWIFIFFKFRMDNPDWYTCDEDGENVKLKDNVPERVIKSYEMWKAREEYYSDERNLMYDESDK